MSPEDGKHNVVLSSSPTSRPRKTWRAAIMHAFLGALVFVTLYLRAFSAPWQPQGRALQPLRTVDPMLRESCDMRFFKRLTEPYCKNVKRWKQLQADSAGASGAEVAREPLNVFQVHTPPRAKKEGAREGCTMQLMQHTFGWSYGMPFVGDYKPPNCEWTNVIFNLTMTSAGRQYDRLALMFLGDIEVWRTSTAEPTSYGIVFSYTKDMTHISSLLRSPQKIIFDLGNLVNEIYTGSFNATLTATFYSPKQLNPPSIGPADLILPISQQKYSAGEEQPSHFALPTQRAISNITLPKNAIRAMVSISASGNQEEEFWWTNVPDTYTLTWPYAPLYGHSAFREIQVLVDGRLAGVVWPRITLFTGGVVPSLWRPIVGISAFDLPEYELDITPFLPFLLAKDKTHTIELKVLSYSEETGSLSEGLGADWLISARVFVWTDPDETWHTTGKMHQAHLPYPLVSFDASTKGNATFNSSATISMRASRNLAFISTIKTSSGDVTATWSQGLYYTSQTTLSRGGNKQTLSTQTNGQNDSPAFGSRHYLWPLSLEYTFTPIQTENGSSFTLDAQIEHAKTERWEGGKVKTVLKGKADWRANMGGNGTTNQVWAEVRDKRRDDESVKSYARKVLADKDAVVEDWVEVDGGRAEGIYKELERDL